ncbi:lactonase family protein [Terracidiphilus gabretensis]|uniref:lactonase family protein n=1 Tax=Terracidiphilus gabretensis TaxID=1577687 RepID=UPI00071BF974|nr:beta-propeller fold lactonase family protein [Terracidiphilus gabretensis]
MKLRKLSQLALASGIGLAVAAALTACQLVTVDYVFLAGSATTTSGGAIQTFAVDSQSGALRYANNSGTKPVDSGGSSPVALAVDGTYANLYVANQGNNTVVHFTIDGSGNLKNSDSITLPDTPVALAVAPSGSALFVAYGSSSATLAEYSLSSGTIGSAVALQTLTVPGYEGDTVVPTAVTVMANGAGVYATLYDKSAYNPGGTTTSTANPGWVYSFAISSGGGLTATTNSPYRAGVKPSGLAADPANRFLYVVDFASNQMVGFGISSGTTLNYLISGPYKTGNQPSAITIDPRGKFIYVANALDSTVTAYAIDLTTGIPSAAISTTGSSNTSTDTQPNAIVVEPAEARYVYTANTLGNSVSGFRLNTNTGVINQTQDTPYPSEEKPAAIVVIPHGNRSSAIVTQ